MRLTIWLLGRYLAAVKSTLKNFPLSSPVDENTRSGPGTLGGLESFLDPFFGTEEKPAGGERNGLQIYRKLASAASRVIIVWGAKDALYLPVMGAQVC